MYIYISLSLSIYIYIYETVPLEVTNARNPCPSVFRARVDELMPATGFSEPKSARDKWGQH